MADDSVGWDTCADDGCIGVRLPTGDTCWAHAADTDLDPALKRLGEDGNLDARGVPITQELLRRLLAAAPKDDYRRPVLTAARFDGATFQQDARFDGATFQGAAEFRSATFQGAARFERVILNGPTLFRSATFEGETRFDGAIFHGNAEFRDTKLRGDARFDGATFQRAAGFYGATFQRAARFDEATFHQARQLGPMLVRKALVLDQVVFRERVQVEVAAAALCCRRTRFLAGVQLRVRWAEVVLEDADLAAPSILTGSPGFQDLEEGRWADALERLQWLRATGILAGRPRLLSVRRADVAGLTVAGMDLRACRFAGALHLDQLHIEESDFAVPPKSWRWTIRQTIAEEHHWRATDPQTPDRSGHDAKEEPATSRREAGRRRGWYRPAHQAPAWLDLELPAPAQIAALYRALRKGREDSKDEPGAADFYYGEMELRRHAKRGQIRGEHRRATAIAAAAEYVILWLYWLLAGYGLRAWRALAALVVVIGLAGIGFSQLGFHHPHPSQMASWLYALQATVSLEAKARQLTGQLTLPGELLRVGLRLTGPVLLGLAILSIRGRVKR